MRPVHSPTFLHYPASPRKVLIASICMSCRRYVAAGDLKLLDASERQHTCEKNSSEGQGSSRSGEYSKRLH